MKFRAAMVYGQYVAAFGLTLALAGCAPQKSAAEKTAPTAATNGSAAHVEAEEHTHGVGPHGGVVADWGGGKYHIELTVDHDKKEATVYVLGEDQKTAAPVKADSVLLSINDPKFQVELKASPQDGETSGASRFIGTHDNLAVVREYSGTISAEVDGTPFAGEFSEEPHTDHPQP